MDGGSSLEGVLVRGLDGKPPGSVSLGLSSWSGQVPQRSHSNLLPEWYSLCYKHPETGGGKAGGTLKKARCPLFYDLWLEVIESPVLCQVRG